MIFMLDNYDSFTFNLVQYLAEIGEEVVVKRNDEVTVEEVLGMEPAGIVVSPGPCRPEGAGISIALILAAAGKVPLLGVCLGHQAIGEAFGGETVRAGRLMHGKTSLVSHDGRGVFTGLPDPFEAMRYHSLVVEEVSLPDCLAITARSDQGELMGLRHKTLAVEGVQFHPESIMTPDGVQLLKNFMDPGYEAMLRR